jgi:hypothetical protein
MRTHLSASEMHLRFPRTLQYKVAMRIPRSAIAGVELLFIAPAALFMTALFVRNLQPQEYEPAHTAQQIVMWYAARPHTGLWLFLMVLPALVLLIGCATLCSQWRKDAELRTATRQFLVLARRHLATILVSGASLMAVGVLAIVALHTLTA